MARVSTLVVLSLIFSSVAWAEGQAPSEADLDPGPVLANPLPFDVPASWGLPGPDWDPPTRTPEPVPPRPRPSRPPEPILER